MACRSSVFCFNLTNHFLTAPHEPPDAVLQFQAHAALTPPRTLRGSPFPYPAHSQGSILPRAGQRCALRSQVPDRFLPSPSSGSYPHGRIAQIHAPEIPSGCSAEIPIPVSFTERNVCPFSMPVVTVTVPSFLLYRIALSQRL